MIVGFGRVIGHKCKVIPVDHILEAVRHFFVPSSRREDPDLIIMCIIVAEQDIYYG